VSSDDGDVKLSLALVALCACSPCPRPNAPRPAPAVTAKPESIRNEPPRARPLVKIALRAFGTSEPATLAVMLRFECNDNIGRLDLGTASGEPIDEVLVRDANGPVAAELTRERALALARAANCPLDVTYRVRAAHDVDAGDPTSTAVDPTRMRAAGERALALPASWDNRAVDVELAIDPGDVRGADAASSFGFGRQRRFVALGRELRRATFIAGSLGRAQFDTKDAHDELVWLGDPAFDPRIVAADFAAFRSAAGVTLGRDAAPLTVLFVVDGRERGELRTARRTASVVMHLGVADPFGSDARVSLATAIVQRWIGERLWLGPHGAEAESAWFNDGVPRAVAALLAFRFGTLSSIEYAEELTRLLMVTATSRLRQRSNRELAALGSEGGALAVARGALYATRIDGQLRGKGATDLMAVTRELMKLADPQGAVSRGTWIKLVSEGLGSDATPELVRFVDDGSAPALDPKALGRCFRIAQRDYRLFELGFDAEATLAAADHHPVALDPHGPAARAGLLATDVVRLANYRPGRPDVEAFVAVERDGGAQRIRYSPAGNTVRGQAVERIAGVAENDCSR
jgi:hypothetical protein